MLWLLIPTLSIYSHDKVKGKAEGHAGLVQVPNSGDLSVLFLGYWLGLDLCHPQLQG